MEKILLAIDAINPNTHALEFACYLGRLTKSRITGVFLENLTDEERPVPRKMHSIVYAEDIDENSGEHKAKIDLIEKNILLFKAGCINREVNYRVHRDRSVPAQELIEESRFADVILVDAETSFQKLYEGSPTQFVRDILKKAECPVIISSKSFEAIDEIIFAYDRSASSVFALKLFTYLFPQLHGRKVIILQVNEEGKWHDADKYQFKEWLKEHYTNLNFEALRGNTDKMLLEYLVKRRNSFLVMGAYGRNSLSEFFKRSHADQLIDIVSQPIFIAHV